MGGGEDVGGGEEGPAAAVLPLVAVVHVLAGGDHPWVGPRRGRGGRRGDPAGGVLAGEEDARSALGRQTAPLKMTINEDILTP